MNNLKKTAMGLMVGAMAIGFSAFKSAPANTKLAPGEFRFYNKSGIANSSPSDYIYLDDSELCTQSEKVCSEVWNIGNQTAPVNGQQLSSYTSPTLVGGNEMQGTFTEQ